MNNSRNPKTLSFILEETLKDQRGIFFIDKCLSDTFKIHYNNILAGSNTVQGSNISIIQLYRESGIELLILNSPYSWECPGAGVPERAERMGLNPFLAKLFSSRYAQLPDLD